MIYTLTDTDQLKVKITIDTNNETILIKNLDDEHLYIELFNGKTTFGAVCWDITGVSQLEFECNLEYKNKWSIDTILVCKNNSIHIYTFDVQNNRFNKLTPLPYKFQNPFVFITGHSGGGTSIVAKSFKYLGINLGKDSGEFSNRKNHESCSFRFWLQNIFSKGRVDDFGTVISSYNYLTGTINAIKITDISTVSARLSNLFPNSKFISIVKPKSKTTFSKEGERFNSHDELDIYKEQHPPIEGNPIFHLDWVRYFTDYNYVNQVLEFIDYPNKITQEEFNTMLDVVGFDSSKLLKK